MIAPNSKSLCRIAEPYYYDYVYTEDIDSVPTEIRDHIEACDHCQTEAARLESLLAETADAARSAPQKNPPNLTNLKLHLACIDRSVTCRTVKPFLPGMLVPDLKISVPTPITVHLDNCPECAQDLKAIRAMNLDSTRLYRLAQLLADKDYKPPLPGELPDVAAPPVELACNQLKPTDLFDYAVPYGFDPADDQYAKFRTAFTQHAAACPDCLEKTRQLHDTVFHILERPDSGVVTVYHLDESLDAAQAAEPNRPYLGFPIKIDVGRPSTAKPHSRPRVLKRWAQAGIAAAAVIAIACLLVSHMPKAGAIDPERVFKAIEGMDSIHVLRYDPANGKLTQEKWVSRTAQLYMFRSGDKFVLWDWDNGVRKTRQNRDAPVEIRRLNEGDSFALEAKAERAFGMVPLEDMSTLPADAEWTHVGNRKLLGSTEKLGVYELTGNQKSSIGQDVPWLRRVFVDPKTKLPVACEYYQDVFVEGKLTLMAVRVVERWTEGEIKDMVSEVFPD